jgi:citrate synthase
MTAHAALGLDGTVVAETRPGQIDGTRGELRVCGYNVHELAVGASWEELLYLLWHDALPDEQQLGELRSALEAARVLSAEARP